MLLFLSMLLLLLPDAIIHAHINMTIHTKDWVLLSFHYKPWRGSSSTSGDFLPGPVIEVTEDTVLSSSGSVPAKEPTYQVITKTLDWIME